MKEHAQSLPHKGFLAIVFLVKPLYNKMTYDTYDAFFQ